ncbi:hypothetical protein V8E54_000051 [Elaphomyces granulatus]
MVGRKRNASLISALGSRLENPAKRPRTDLYSEVSLLTEDEKESQNDQKPQGIQQAQESLKTEIVSLLTEDEKESQNDQKPQGIQQAQESLKTEIVSLLTEDKKESQNDQKPQGIQQAQESLNTEISNQRSANSFLPINLITPMDDELDEDQVPVKQDQETFDIPVVKLTTRRGRGQGGRPQISSDDSTRSAFACNRCKQLKLKCDNNRESCRNCGIRCLPCCFTDPISRKIWKRGQVDKMAAEMETFRTYVPRLLRYIKYIESRLHSLGIVQAQEELARVLHSSPGGSFFEGSPGASSAYVSSIHYPKIQLWISASDCILLLGETGALRVGLYDTKLPTRSNGNAVDDRRRMSDG